MGQPTLLLGCQEQLPSVLWAGIGVQGAKARVFGGSWVDCWNEAFSDAGRAGGWFIGQHGWG